MFDFDLTIDGVRFFQSSGFGFNGESMAFVESAESLSEEVGLRALRTVLCGLLGDEEAFSALELWSDEGTCTFVSTSRESISAEDRAYITKWVESLDAIFASDLELSEQRMWASLLKCEEQVGRTEVPIATQRVCDDLVFDLYRRPGKAGNSYDIYEVSSEGREWSGSAGDTLESALHSLDVKVWVCRKHLLQDRFDMGVFREYSDRFDLCPAAPWEPPQEDD